MQTIEKAGFLSVTLNMRGHGHGNEVSTPRIYRARADDDVKHVCEHIRTQCPRIAALYGMGFSMGANQLICFLATSNRSSAPSHDSPGSSPRLIDAAVSISNPFDLTALNEHFKHGIARAYTGLIAQPLKKILWQGRHQLPISREQFWRGMLSMSVRNFDTHVQVPSMGLETADEYYSICSSRQFAVSIDVPTLVVNAKDDPLVPIYAVPVDQLRKNPHVTLLVTERGGHIGWHTGYSGISQHSWTDSMAVKFFKKHLQGDAEQALGSKAGLTLSPEPSNLSAKL
ncbi:hypothetical protein CYMTET_29786 [Cymbomonas tetramitiformis]|uniref:AB hydrolase-1 domain-containing protein n=1 Tax=Cymbomonas tetramitiformis TaxID=36881 RepID=A0AAE0FKP9_9CHLO|nr:hypothetical protein CYMTET_29786 [Cymbomonas tetramitiformis]